MDRSLNGAYGKYLKGIDLKALVAAGRQLIDIEPLTFNELGKRLCEQWPDQNSEAGVRDEFGFDQGNVNPDGTLSLTTHFSSTERAIRKVLSYGSQVTVMEPPELIQELQRHIRSLVELYKLSIL